MKLLPYSLATAMQGGYTKIFLQRYEKHADEKLWTAIRTPIKDNLGIIQDHIEANLINILHEKFKGN